MYDQPGISVTPGGPVAEWLACWTQAQNGLGSNRSSETGSSPLKIFFENCVLE